jgi:hypothetical protein
LSILRTGFSGLPTSPQSSHLLAAAITHQEIPIQHAAGESLRLHVVVTNTRSAIWLFQTNNGQYGVRLGWKWIDRQGKNDFATEGRAPIHQDIFPGEREELNIAIWPPSDAGEYVVGGVCKLCSDHSTIRHEQRRFNQHAMRAAPTAAPTTTTQDRPAICGSSPHPERHFMDSAHRCPLARSARTLWPVAPRGQSLLPLAAGGHLASALRGGTSAS